MTATVESTATLSQNACAVVFAIGPVLLVPGKVWQNCVGQANMSSEQLVFITIRRWFQISLEPNGTLNPGQTLILALVLSGCLAVFFPAAMLGFQASSPYESKLPECSEESQFEKLLAKGSNVNIPNTARESALRQAVKLCAQDPAVYESLGVLLLQQQRFQEAVAWIRRGLKIVPQNLNLIMALGTALLSAGQPEEALLVFQSLPPNAKTEFYLGMTYRALRDHKAAREALAQSFKMGYHDPYVLYALIEEDRYLHDTQAGLRDFQTFDQSFPHSPWLHLLLGNAYNSQKDIPSAEAEYQKAASLDPMLPVVHFKLGVLSFSRADYATAVQDFRQEVKLNPTFGEAYLYLGVTLRRIGKDREALPYLEEAVTRDPNSALAYGQLASAQTQVGQTQRAIQTLQEGERRFPTDAAFPAQLARLLKTLGEVHAAEEQATRAQSLNQEGNLMIPGVSPNHALAEHGVPHDPRFGDLRHCLELEDVRCASQTLSELNDAELQGNPEYLNLKAQTLNLEQNRKQALAVIQRALLADPNQGSYWMTQGRVYQQLGNQVEAIKSFLRAEQLKANPVDAAYYIGMSFFLLGDYYGGDNFFLRAAQHFKTALKLDPHFDKAEFMLGAINAIESKLPQAKLNFEKALEMNPKNPYYILHYGVLLRRLGDSAGALRQMKLAQKLAPSYARTYFSLGGLEEQIGDYKEARAQLEAGLRLDPKDSQAYYTLGRVYHQLGLESESEEAFRKFQQLKSQKPVEIEKLAPSIPSAESSSVLQRP